MPPTVQASPPLGQASIEPRSQGQSPPNGTLFELLMAKAGGPPSAPAPSPPSKLVAPEAVSRGPTGQGPEPHGVEPINAKLGSGWNLPKRDTLSPWAEQTFERMHRDFEALQMAHGDPVVARKIRGH